ncbi:uncharacterized protein LOC129572024, partial [Sitodiplosis mosellana]|uniref:uncharacterized protein LOC129572024 n=1 Tax=Sitodiplosis mosellana TaxID=263140 RepID=UPI0024447E32
MKQDARNTISVIDLNMRTTSSLEALNSIIQRTFPGQTTIFKFVESLKLLESIKSSDLHQLTSGFISNQQLERRRRADKHRNDKINHFTGLLTNKEISVAVFLESMSGKDVLPTIAYSVTRSKRALRLRPFIEGEASTSKGRKRVYNSKHEYSSSS